jgi:uncharacterized protein YerC
MVYAFFLYCIAVNEYPRLRHQYYVNTIILQLKEGLSLEEKNGRSFEAIDTLVHECLNEKSTDVEIARQPRGKKLDSCKRARDR